MEVVQLIETDDLSNNYNDILESVCNTLFDILVNSDITNIIDYSNAAHFTITYKITTNKKKTKKIKEHLKHLGAYQMIKNDDSLLKEDEMCNICLNHYKHREYKRVLQKCKHVFHKKCIDKWLIQSNKMDCPRCRQSYCDILLK